MPLSSHNFVAPSHSTLKFHQFYLNIFWEFLLKTFPRPTQTESLEWGIVYERTLLFKYRTSEKSLKSEKTKGESFSYQMAIKLGKNNGNWLCKFEYEIDSLEYTNPVTLRRRRIDSNGKKGAWKRRGEHHGAFNHVLTGWIFPKAQIT